MLPHCARPARLRRGSLSAIGLEELRNLLRQLFRKRHVQSEPDFDLVTSRSSLLAYRYRAVMTALA